MAKQAKIDEAGLSRLSWAVMLLSVGLVYLLWSGGLFYFSTLAHQVDRRLQDTLSAHLSPSPERVDLLCLGIDEASLSPTGVDEETLSEAPVLRYMAERFPWNRRVWAEGVDRLAGAGARLIVLDLLFTEPSDDPEADRLLAEAIARHRDKVVLASNWAPVGAREGQNVMGMQEPMEIFLGPMENETAFGFANFWPDADDDILRKANYRTTAREINRMRRAAGEPRFDSLAAVAARKLGVAPPEMPRRLRFAGKQQVTWTGDGQAGAAGEPDAVLTGKYLAHLAYKPRSIHEIFVPDLWRTNYGSGSGIAGKVVLIGPVAPRFHDEHLTSSGFVTGPQLHMQALACLLENSFWMYPPPWAEWAVLFGLGLLGMTLVIILRNPFALLAYLVVLGAVLVFGCGFLADRTGVLFTGFPGFLGFLAVTVSGGSVEFLMERARRKRLHRHLQRSVSADVADEMVRSPAGYFDMAMGRRRRVVVLFSDVRGFTARSEQIEPEQLVEQLNEYFSRMVRIVFQQGGTLDKFIGDAVMVTWGGLSDEQPGEIVRAAVTAAGDMRTALEDLNRDWERRQLAPFEMGVGIHFGEAVVGEIGAEERSDFTAIGDAVNVASRVEGLTRHVGMPVLLTGEAVTQLEGAEAVLPLGRFRVKGRQGILDLFTLAAGVPTGDADLLAEALGKIVDGDWEAAEAALGRFGDASALRGVRDLYLKEIAGARGNAGEAWDGVVRLETK